MNVRDAVEALLAAAGQNALLERLVFVSVEFAALALMVGALVFILRLRQPRLAALLWLMVLAKPLAGLVIGTPLPLLALSPAGGAGQGGDAGSARNQYGIGPGAGGGKPDRGCEKRGDPRAGCRRKLAGAGPARGADALAGGVFVFCAAAGAELWPAAAADPRRRAPIGVG